MHSSISRFEPRAVIAAGTLAVMTLYSPPALAQQGPPADFTAIVKQQTPAVVAITTKQRVEEQDPPQSLPDNLPFREFFRRYYGNRSGPQPQQERQALGSGFVIGADGHIVTNNHVVEDAEEIHVVFNDKTTVPARLVGRDPATDIAVLKVDPRPDMAVINWGDSDAAEPGSWVIAIGSPFGLGGTVTVGVVSARSRDIHSGPYDDYIQRDASINRGNTGGPLFNARGASSRPTVPTQAQGTCRGMHPARSRAHPTAPCRAAGPSKTVHVRPSPQSPAPWSCPGTRRTSIRR